MTSEELADLIETLLEDNIYFTLEGCYEEGEIAIPKTFFNAVWAWAGECTDPNSGGNYYGNPFAMFTALNLIYRLLEYIRQVKRDE